MDQPAIPPGPPQSEVENSFSVTQPPTSHLFPSRPRANSTPSAGPSSLSQLLAQATTELPEGAVEIVPPSGDPQRGDRLSHYESATTLSPPLPSPNQHAQSAPHAPTPLRPGSRASRASTSSRFSAARLPTLAAASSSPSTVKAMATTALTEHSLQSSTTASQASSLAGPPSPVGSLTEGMANILNRRRTTSHHISRSSPLGPRSGSSQTTTALVNLASNWAFGKKKKVDSVAEPPSEASTSRAAVQDNAQSKSNKEVSASDLLRRF